MKQSFALAINPDAVADEIEYFITGAGSAVQPDGPATQVFADSVNSTK
jgi:hypothetical protein